MKQTSKKQPQEPTRNNQKQAVPNEAKNQKNPSREQTRPEKKKQNK